MIQQSTRIALAGFMTLAMSFPGPTLALDKKPVIIVMPVLSNPNGAAVAQRTRHLVIDHLARRGYVIHDGAGPQKAALGRGYVELRIDTKPRRLTGSYTVRAVTGLTATLRDGLSKRHLGRFETPASRPRRIATTCAITCQDQVFLEQAQQLAPGLAGQIHRRLARLPAGELTDPEQRITHTLTLRGIDPGHLPQIEQFLGFFPGIDKIRRDRSSGAPVLYRYRQTGKTHTTEISLRKMLHHLQLNAGLQRVGDSFVITATPAARPVKHPRDW